MPSRTLPKSVVKVVRTSGWLPPMDISPTEDSGFAWVLVEKMRFTASAWASKREGLVGCVSLVVYETGGKLYM